MSGVPVLYEDAKTVLLVSPSERFCVQASYEQLQQHKLSGAIVELKTVDTYPGDPWVTVDLRYVALVLPA